MNFAEQLKAKKDLKVIAFANEYAAIIKPSLEKSAEDGYSAHRVVIDTNIDEEKGKLQLYSDPLFTENLNKLLDGVKVKYEKEFIENLIIKGYGHYKHSLVFKW